MMDIRKKLNGRRIFINALLLTSGHDYRNAGISGYSRELLSLLPAFCHEAKDMLFWAFVSDPAYQPPPGILVHRPNWSTRRPVPRILWEQTLQTHVIQKLNGDLYHGLAFAAPLAAEVPTVITVHDLSFLRYPQTFSSWQRRYLSWVTRESAQRAAAIIAVSESTKNDVVQRLGVPEERVHAIYNGISDRFKPLPAAEIERWRQQNGLPERFIFYLGTLQPRKNVTTLIKAYAQWRQQSGIQDVPLMLAGARGWGYKALFSLVTALHLGDAVRFTGFLPDEELPYWYNAATLFAYPSLYEGFGLPVAEAMACGTPVIAADASALPEVVGEAGLLLPPQDIDAWADALQRVLLDDEEAARLAHAGRQRSLAFSWVRTVRETIGVYRQILG